MRNEAEQERPGRIFAPWTPEQVDALNRWQSQSYAHPFTCSGCVPSRILYATPAGWRCAFCGHEQSWAHDFMAGPPMPHPLAAFFPAPDTDHA